MDEFDKRLLKEFRGPEPVYIEGWEPQPAHCPECGQVLPGEVQESPHAAACPCLRCEGTRRYFALRRDSGEEERPITFRKIAPVCPAGTLERPEY